MTTIEREISRDYEELDKLLAELRTARKKVEAHKNRSATRTEKRAQIVGMGREFR